MELTREVVARANIALSAGTFVGSTDWSYEASRLLDGYPAETNKRSLFVAQVLGWSDAHPGYPNRGRFFKHPPNSGQWADATYDIPGWVVLDSGVEPEPGDVAAQKADYSDAFGHVMIVGTNKTLVGTVDLENVEPQGVVARIPMKKDIVRPDLAVGPIVFRKFIGR